MEIQQIRVGDMLDNIAEYNTKHPLTPPAAAATALFAEAAAVGTSLRDYAELQTTGHHGFLGKAATRRELADDLVHEMRSISRIGRTLNPDVFPNAREDFRMPQNLSYASIVATGRRFANLAGPMEAVFIEHGRPATFIADLEALAEEVEQAAGPRHEKRQDRVGATAALAAKVTRALAIRRELDGIIVPLVEHDAELLAKWKSASHVAHGSGEPEEEEPGSGDGSGGEQPPPAPAP